MKILFTVLLLPFMAMAGAIRGRVVDYTTNDPLPFTNVFLANTTVGTSSDTDGYFVLENCPSGRFALVVSHIGFELFIQNIDISVNSDTRLHARLKPRAIEGEQVTIEADRSRGWDKYLWEFERYFIGQTPNAEKCSIQNPEVLALSRDPVTRELIAKNNRPLIVLNGALGYRLEIMLSVFRWIHANGAYRIYPQFIPIDSPDETKLQKWRELRLETFKNSTRYFFYCLARNTYNNHFKMTTYTGSRIGNVGEPIESFTITKFDTVRSIFRLVQDDPLEITQNELRTTSTLTFNYGFVDFDSLGNIHSHGSLRIGGHWAKLRVADDLPFDYFPVELD